MSKRGRGDSFGGGTGDVSPQWLTLAANTQTVANTYSEESNAIPITRFPLAKGRAIVMEMLKVQFRMAEWDSNPAAAGSTGTSEVQVATISQTNVFPDSPQNFAYAIRQWRGAFTAAGSYEAVSDNPLVIDLTDGAGHGVLVATDNLFFGVNTIGFAGVASFSCKLLYRFKEISLQEYIGIVQAQQ